jgi:hypothetical protein
MQLTTDGSVDPVAYLLVIAHTVSLTQCGVQVLCTVQYGRERIYRMVQYSTLRELRASRSCQGDDTVQHCSVPVSSAADDQHIVAHTAHTGCE